MSNIEYKIITLLEFYQYNLKTHNFAKLKKINSHPDRFQPKIINFPNLK